jgi:hypothetical protein
LCLTFLRAAAWKDLISSADPIRAKPASGPHPHHIIRNLTSEATMEHHHDRGRIGLSACDVL